MTGYCLLLLYLCSCLGTEVKQTSPSEASTKIAATTDFSTPSKKSSSVAGNQMTVRSALSLTEDRDKSFIFYHSTFPVAGLDEAVWREDQNGQLLLAGQSSCSGCLCYSFDHRYPVSFITGGKIQEHEQIRSLMTSPSNMQAISHRSNLFKSNNPESKLTGGLMEMFGCSQQVMRAYYEDDFAEAKEMEQYLVNSYRLNVLQQAYDDYLNQLESYEEAGGFEVKISEEIKKNDRAAVKEELRRRAQEISRTVYRL